VQLTSDHTYVQEYIDKHESISREMADQYSHYLIKVLDGGKDIPDLFPAEKEYEELNSGEIFMLCSDGLILSKTETNTQLFYNYLKGASDLKEAAQNLISYVYLTGSDDNITLILAEYGSFERDHRRIKKYRYPPEHKRKNALIRIFSR
jgi:protein phosphatase